MADIAETAGVSRQTLYTLFGNKDELVVATIGYVAEQNFADVEAGLKACGSLDEELDVYFRLTIVRAFELIENSEDLEDIMSGHSEAGRVAIESVKAQHAKLVTRLLSPYRDEIEASGHTVSHLANFCVTCARGFKYSARNKRELNALLTTLKKTLLQAAKVSRGAARAA